MTDKGEREIRKWALRRNGDPITNHDIVELVFAFADDFDDAFADSLSDRAQLNERVEVLEQWRHESATTCVDRIRKIAKEAAHEVHEPVHNAHLLTDHAAPRRATDSDKENHRDERDEFPTGDQRTLFEMVLGWSIIKWLVAGVVLAGITFGISYWGSSCAAEKVEKDALEKYEIHFPISSPSP